MATDADTEYTNDWYCSREVNKEDSYDEMLTDPESVDSTHAELLNSWKSTFLYLKSDRSIINL